MADHIQSQPIDEVDGTDASKYHVTANDGSYGNSGGSNPMGFDSTSSYAKRESYMESAATMDDVIDGESSPRVYHSGKPYRRIRRAKITHD